MIKIKPINEFNFNEIITKLSEGKKIYKIDVKGSFAYRLEDLSIKQIRAREESDPDQYAYFEVIDDIKLRELEKELTIVEKHGVLNPPSGRLAKAAREIYDISIGGMTTKQILMAIAEREMKGQR